MVNTISCRCGSAKQCQGRPFAFLWKHAIFGYPRNRNPFSGQHEILHNCSRLRPHLIYQNRLKSVDWTWLPMRENICTTPFLSIPYLTLLYFTFFLYATIYQTDQPICRPNDSNDELWATDVLFEGGVDTKQH
jgi:hypothetical protein